MRNRSWRRWTTENIVKRRLKIKSQNYGWRFYSSNGDKLRNPSWVDMIGTNYHFDAKTDLLSYTKWTKRKYSPNRNLTWRDLIPRRESFGTREKDKREFIKILQENGLR
jgi:hypothetical protein